MRTTTRARGGIGFYGRMLAVGVGLAAGVGYGQPVLDVMVWGADVYAAKPEAYPAAVGAELGRYLERYRAYETRRKPEGTSGLDKMVWEARVRYERRLAAVTADPQGPALAAAYVDALRPCYEWEGGHECPEREAVFASRYQSEHPDGPLREYLPLLAAHRWLCAAEAYEFERSAAEAERSRREYETALWVALRSESRLVQAAAEGLAARGKCFR